MTADLRAIGIVAVLLVPVAMAGAAFTEDFESGFTGSPVGDHAEWGPSGKGPTATAGSGVAGSVGLPHDGDIFNWSVHPFDWNDAAFPGTVVLQMDFTTNSSAHFDDDRLVWTTDKGSTSSSKVLGAQLDQSDGGIVTYWRNSGGTRIQDTIAATPGLKANTWYRFRNEITKLTATSASLEVSLQELDGAGNPFGPIVSGTVADTSAWGGGGRAPATTYFTAAQMWPAYKNYNHGFADNAYYDLVPEPATMALLGLGALALLRKRRR